MKSADRDSQDKNLVGSLDRFTKTAGSRDSILTYVYHSYNDKAQGSMGKYHVLFSIYMYIQVKQNIPFRHDLWDVSNILWNYAAIRFSKSTKTCLWYPHPDRLSKQFSLHSANNSQLVRFSVTVISVCVFPLMMSLAGYEANYILLHTQEWTLHYQFYVF